MAKGKGSASNGEGGNHTSVGKKKRKAVVKKKSAGEVGKWK